MTSAQLLIIGAALLLAAQLFPASSRPFLFAVILFVIVLTGIGLSLGSLRNLFG